MTTESNGRRGRTLASAAAALLLAGGITAVGVGLNSSPSQGDGPAAAASVSPASTPASTAQVSAPQVSAPQVSAPQRPTPAPPPAPDASLPASIPVSVRIESIGVDSPLLQLGKQPGGEVEVPPGEPGSPAGWYKESPTPGQTGSAVILGHVNSTRSPVGVFYRLHELKPGAQVSVTRADRTVAVFAVDRVDVYHKATFPTIEVYRNADRPELRLITCGGYDPASGEYLDNTVVYARLVSNHPA